MAANNQSKIWTAEREQADPCVGANNPATNSARSTALVGGVQRNQSIKVRRWRPAQVLSSTRPLLPRKPDSWPSLRFHPTECSPLELAQCVSMAVAYYQWAIPHISSDQALITLHAATRTDAYQMNLAALCLAMTVHCLPEGPSERMHCMFKGHIMNGILKIFSKPNTIASLRTLGTLASLAGFEVGRETPEAEIHLRGIASALAAQPVRLEYHGYGGGLRKFLEHVDLLWAVKNERWPVYSMSIQPLLPPKHEVARRRKALARDSSNLPTDLCKPSLAWQWSHTLHRSRVSRGAANVDDLGEDDIMAGLARHDSDEQQLFLLHAESGTRVRAVGGSTPSKDPLCSHAVSLWQEHLLSIARQIGSSSEIAVACRLGAALMKGGLRSSSVATDLYICLCANEADSWDMIVGTHIRLLLIALVSSRDPMQRRRLGAEYTRRAGQMRLYPWLWQKLVVVEFIHLLIHLRSKQQQFTGQ